MENINQELPEDLQREILLRMPSKSLLKFICVSKKWASIIRDKSFRDEHYLQSKTRPRLLFTFCSLGADPTLAFLFHPVHQKEEPLLSSGQQDMLIPNDQLPEISEPIRGLICLHLGTKVVICNPGINKFVTLPELVSGEPKTSVNESVSGYDEVTKVFKVLATWKAYGQSYGLKHQVFTVGSGENSWRTIVCKHRHCRVTNSLCEKGIVYYGGRASPDYKSVLMSFNMSTEEFTVIEVPKGVVIPYSVILVNYNGHIALVKDPEYELYANGVVQLWVRNEITREWRDERVAIPCWRDIVVDTGFSFKGTIGTRELVFVRDKLLDDGLLCVYYYYTFTKKLEKFDIKVGVGGSYRFAATYLDHVDSLFLM